MKTIHNPTSRSKPYTEPCIPPGATFYLPELRRQGIQLTLTAGRLHLSPPERLTAEIAALVAEHANEIRAELEAEQAAGSGGTPESLGQMDTDAHPADLDASLDLAVREGSATAAFADETRALIAWFEAAQEKLPARPFDLYPHLRIVEPARFYRFIAEWIADGEKSPHPGLTGNLRRLREVVTKAQDGL